MKWIHRYICNYILPITCFLPANFLVYCGILAGILWYPIEEQWCVLFDRNDVPSCCLFMTRGCVVCLMKSNRSLWHWILGACLWLASLHVMVWCKILYQNITKTHCKLSPSMTNISETTKKWKHEITIETFMCMSITRSVLSTISFTMCGVVCYQLVHFSSDHVGENICTASYYHHQTRSMYSLHY